MSESVAKAGGYWSNRTAKQKDIKVSSAWQNSPILVEYVNSKLGAPNNKRYGGGFRYQLERRLKDRNAKRAISVGGGNGTKEMHYVASGLVEHFDIFEASEARIEQGKEVAKKNGVTDKVTFHLVTEEEYPDNGKYDLVYWDSALHHMPDVYEALFWSKSVLNKGGLLAMNEYVGPDRFQWTEASLLACDDFRNALPSRFFKGEGDQIIPRKAQRVNRESLIRRDPSEAMDSSRILDALKLSFPDACEIIPLGGAIYHVALRQILPNFTTDEDATYVKMVTVLDHAFERTGDIHFAVAFAEK